MRPGVVKNGAQDQLKNIIYSLLQKYRPPIDANVIEEYQQLIYDDMTGHRPSDAVHRR